MTPFIFIIAATCFGIIQAAADDPGPQQFGQSTPRPPTNGIVMKDAVLYLTPSQIRALEANRGLNKVIPLNGPSKELEAQRNKLSQEDLQKLEAEITRQLQSQDIYLPSQITPLNVQRQPSPITEEPERPLEYSPQYQTPWVPIQKPREEQKFFIPPPQYIPPEQQHPQIQQQHQQQQFQRLQEEQLRFQEVPQAKPEEQLRFVSLQPLSLEGQQQKLPESYSFIKIFTGKEVHEKPKFQLFHPIPHDHNLNEDFGRSFEIQTDPLHRKQYRLIPYVPEKTLDQPKIEEIQEIAKWASQLEKLKKPENVQKQEHVIEVKEDSKDFEEEFKKQLSEFKYAPKFEDHKNAADFQKFLIKIEKENAIAKAEAIRKSAPVVVSKEISVTKRRPIPVVKHINVPVPTPVLVPFPKPFEVKVPQPYPVPLEIIQPVPVPIVKTETVEVEKPVPYEVEKHVPVPITKNVLVKVDKPYLVERYVPLEVKKEVPVEIPVHKPEKLTILRHVWKH